MMPQYVVDRMINNEIGIVTGAKGYIFDPNVLSLDQKYELLVIIKNHNSRAMCVTCATEKNMA